MRWSGALRSFALCALLGAPGVLVAQDPPAPTAPLVEPDSSPLFERPNGALLRPGSVVFDLTLHRGGVQTPLGTRTVEVTETQVGGVPAWLIAERRSGSAVPTTDSLWLSRADLTPLRWAATIGSALLGASFTRDSVIGAVQSYQGRATFIAPLLPGVLVTPGMVERLIELLPLRTDYRASASLLLLDLGTPRTLPAEIRVLRAERVRMAGLEHDCWVVAVRAGVMESRVWVTRGDRRVVRGEQGEVRAEIRGH